MACSHSRKTRHDTSRHSQEGHHHEEIERHEEIEYCGEARKKNRVTVGMCKRDQREIREREREMKIPTLGHKRFTCLTV